MNSQDLKKKLKEMNVSQAAVAKVLGYHRSRLCVLLNQDVIASELVDQIYLAAQGIAYSRASTPPPSPLG
jgi:predicted XRE-type DNA-binding protein